MELLITETSKGTVNQKSYCFFLCLKTERRTYGRKKEIKVPPYKQFIMDIGKIKYTVNLHSKQGTGKTYKDKIIKLIKREIERI